MANRGRVLDRKRTTSAANREQERLRSRAWYAANRDRALDYAATYREAHAEEIREHARQYRRVNAAKLRRASAAYYRLHGDERRSASRDWYRLNRDVALERAREYRRANADAIREARRRWFESHPDYKSMYYAANRERWRTYNKRSNSAYRESDPVRYALETRLGRALRKALHGEKAGRTSFELLGYTREQLASHLEARFLPGMTWENVADWHIDHVIPKSWFSYRSGEDPQFHECWGLDNLQPLWGRDNQSKGNRRAG